MFSFAKFGPTDYVIHFQRGRIRREGRGLSLSFFYWKPMSSIVSVPAASSDIPFVFQLLTSDFQTVRLRRGGEAAPDAQLVARAPKQKSKSGNSV